MEEVEVGQVSSVGTRLQRLEQTSPGAIGSPSRETLVERLPGTVTRGHVASEGTGACPPGNGVFDLTPYTGTECRLKPVPHLVPHPGEPMTIGTLAKLAGVGVETVRFYEREGLLQQPHRPGRGFRRYTPETVRRVRFIRRAKALGFTLDEIRDLLTLRSQPGAPCSAVREQAQAKARSIDEKIRELQKLRDAVSSLVDACAGDAAVVECSILGALEADRAEEPCATPHRRKGAAQGERHGR